MVPVMHQGGIVGQPGSRRLVSMAAFAGAQRYHSGGIIGPNEVPIIAKRGERALPAARPG